MPRRSTTYNRTNRNTETPSLRRQRREARANGRGGNSAFTGGARSANMANDNAAAMRNAWSNRESVQTYTRSRTGAMSVNGTTAGGSTWTFSQRDDEGNKVRQSGRSQISDRQTRYRDVRSGFNNISNRALQAMLEAGQVSPEELAGARRGSRNSLGLATG